jgi:hypothetical protein
MNNIELANLLAVRYGWTPEEEAYHLAIYNRERPVVDKPVVEHKRISLNSVSSIDIGNTWRTSSPMVRGAMPYIRNGAISHKRAKMI